MQQSNELCIGNSIRNADGTICQVTQLSINEMGINISASCNPVGRQFGGMVENYSAIPLTREILQSVGFTIRDNTETQGHAVFTKDDLILNRNFQLCNSDGTITINNRRLQFVHQLQNLHLLITGAELQIIEADLI